MTACAALLVLCAAAQQKPPEVTLEGAAGWAGRSTPGLWAPVSVEVDNRGKKDLDGSIVVQWAYPGASQESARPGSLAGAVGPRHELPFSIAAGARKRASLSILAPDQEGYHAWAFFAGSDGKVHASRELIVRDVRTPRRIVAVVGTDRPDGILLPDAEVVWTSPEQLPDDRRGYAALHALVWLDGKAVEVRSPAQLDALSSWVSCGGRLVVARANDVGIAGTPLAKLLPVRMRGVRESDGLPALAGIPGASGPGPAGRTLVMDVDVLRGHPSIRDPDGRALIVQALHDAGSVTFAAFDPARAPAAGWAHAARLWAQLLGLPAAATPVPESRLTYRPPPLVGSTSLTLLAASFPDVAPPALGGLFVIVIVYLLVVGPGDYAVLRFFRRLEFTWFTFPVYVGIFTAIILSIGGRFMRSTAYQRETAVVDHYVDTGFARRRAVEAVLAPADVTFETEDAEPLSSDFLQRDLYRERDTSRLERVRVTHGRTRQVRDWGVSRGATALAYVDRAGPEPCPLAWTATRPSAGEARLTLKNSGPAAYTDAVLVAPDGVFRVGRIGPGDSVVEAGRVHESLAAWAFSEGKAPASDPEIGVPQHVYAEEGQPRTGIRQETLDGQARRLLIGLSAGLRNDAELSGLSSDLALSGWVSAGGSVLLAVLPDSESELRLSPPAGRRTACVLARFFQGPRP
jgi:hypothetical protein